jgi:hypothetical protein
MNGGDLEEFIKEEDKKVRSRRRRR